MQYIKPIAYGYNMVNQLTNGQLSNGIAKNVGNMYGKVTRWFARDPKRQELIGDKVKKIGQISENVFGKGSLITSNIKDAGNVIKGEPLEIRKWDYDPKTDIKDNNANNALLPHDLSFYRQPYLKNLYGTKYKRYTPQFHRRRRTSQPNPQRTAIKPALIEQTAPAPSKRSKRRRRAHRSKRVLK